ncbi:MAG: hypothetical protein MJ060_04650, partial [Clostridia bacterium]|nr:hypothetical protein [Clostridia bacterium]
ICTIGFFIEGIFALILIIGCCAVNTIVNSKLFFISSVIEPTFWTWAALILAIIGIVVVFKLTKKEGKNGKKKAIIALCICVAVILVVSIAYGMMNTSKKAQYLGNWNLEKANYEAVISQKDLDAIKSKGIDESNAVVISIKDDFTFEACLIGADVTGSYKLNDDNIVLYPSGGDPQDFGVITLLYDQEKLNASLGPIQFATLQKSSIDAKEASEQVKKALGKAAIDYALYLAGIDQKSAEQVFDTLQKFSDMLDALDDVDKDQIVKAVKAEYAKQFTDAYNKLSDDQKAQLKGLYLLLS